MNRVNKFLVAAFMSAAMLFPGMAQAMQIKQFDKMADQDQVEYIHVLINGAEKVLTDEGRPDLAAKVEHLFTTKLGNDLDTIGMGEFERNLAIVRADNADHPNDPQSEVEDVMIMTLENNHIPLPDSFYDVAANFHPKFPPKNALARNTDAPQPPQQ
ncbi:MAG TPA: hypothetical protein VL625_12935 [Patescibacteria group bacterium]|jgi:hypothetical protein|nr:hypothetical protein [Patescibacteria group bacterium]